MTREECRHTARLFNALADGKTLRDGISGRLNAEDMSPSWKLAHWEIVEPPPIITELVWSKEVPTAFPASYLLKVMPFLILLEKIESSSSAESWLETHPGCEFAGPIQDPKEASC